MRSAIEKLCRALPTIGLVVALLGGGLCPSTAAAAPATLDWPFGILRPLAAPGQSAEDRIIELVNAERALAGLAPLARHAGLAAAAGDYAAAMAGGALFSHTGLDGSDVQERGETHGYVGWTFLGENLAAGQSTPERVVQAWMASPTHRANVLAAQACDIGVGRATARGARYDVYWVMEIGCGLFSG